METHQNHYLCAVADGVGGLQNGHVASSHAISELRQLFRGRQMGLKDCFHLINTSLVRENQKHSQTSATTLTSVLINVETMEAMIAHVGDSRAYVITETLWRTHDHSLVEQLVDLGVITEEAAFTHPEKHRITQALGINTSIGVEVNYQGLKNAILLLCSDGLHNFVRDRDIATIAREHDPQTACIRLMEIARTQGSNDDITIIFFKIGDER
ncbi:MAG: serine/threonine-protein phosphatase [Candidatus Thermoplasmatota archaeon]|nr:serine/threonine-protein phosphatase [Candidatus Thermoplasmatota archaeon]